MVASAITLIML